MQEKLTFISEGSITNLINNDHDNPSTRSQTSFCFALSVSTLTILCFVFSMAKGWLPKPFTPELLVFSLVSFLFPSFPSLSSSPRPSSSKRRFVRFDVAVPLLSLVVSPSGNNSSSGITARVCWHFPSGSMTHKSTWLPLPRSLRTPDKIARCTKSIPSSRVRDGLYPSSKTAIAANPPLPRAVKGKLTSVDPWGWIARR
mmetsp:Transcript_7656/g.18745  ORF Transcript_7656/g.18745 Transcript_7656/m.18745 type:complete len:200 (-) Transcript_7656:988-1587(-)